MELSGQSSEQKVRGMREQHRCSGPEAFVEKELSIARLKLNRHREVSGRSQAEARSVGPGSNVQNVVTKE